MPALIGGFLRRDTSYINRLNIARSFHSRALVNTRWAGSFGLALANEPGSLGPMNRGNLRIHNRVGSTRSFSQTSKLSLRMNLCFKADPSIALLVDSEGWNQQKGVLQIRFTVIDSFSNISTRGNLDSAQTSPTLFMTSKRRSRSDLELLVDYITGQYGNSVKALVKFFVRVPCLYEIKFHRRCATWSETKLCICVVLASLRTVGRSEARTTGVVYRVVYRNSYMSKTSNWSRLYGWGGGKIAEKAKAECNISDIVIKCSDLDNKAALRAALCFFQKQTAGCGKKYHPSSGLAASKMMSIGIELSKTFRLNSQPLVYLTTHALPGPFLMKAWLETIKYYGKLNSVWHYEPHNLRNCCLTNYALSPPSRHFVHIQYRCYSTQDQPHLSCRKNGHQLLTSNSYGTTVQKKQKVLEWPNPAKLKLIESRVHKQQIELVRIAKQYGKYSDKVKRAQDVMSKSLDFRMVAVQLLTKSTKNPYSKTPGVDGNQFENTPSLPEAQPEYKINMILLLREILLQTAHEASPVLFIPKANGQNRPIGIPTIRDRALQSLVKLVVEPLIEMDSDIHSYGFRRYRSAKNAVAVLRSHLKTDNDMQHKWILDADIEGFFDNRNHQWLIDNVPLPKRLRTILDGLLKAGSIYHGKYEFSLAGTPQDGIISPILANFVLDGLEKAVYDSISSLTKAPKADTRIVIRRKDGTITIQNSHLLVVSATRSRTKFAPHSGLKRIRAYTASGPGAWSLRDQPI